MGEETHRGGGDARKGACVRGHAAGGGGPDDGAATGDDGGRGLSARREAAVRPQLGDGAVQEGVAADRDRDRRGGARTGRGGRGDR